MTITVETVALVGTRWLNLSATLNIKHLTGEEYRRYSFPVTNIQQGIKTMVKGMYSNQTIVTDIHFEIAEKLRAALAPAIAELYVNPDDVDAESWAVNLIDDAFDTIYDLAMDVESNYDQKYNGRED